MKRYLLVPRIGTGQTRQDPYRVDLKVPWIQVAKLGAHWLVKVNVDEGTVADDMTIADLDSSHKVVKPESLTVAQRSALRTWLINHGYDVTGLTSSIQTRRDLLLFIVRSLGKQSDMSMKSIIEGYDIA